MTTLRLILGDQLSHELPILQTCNREQDVIFMCEVWEEATYVKHHKKKIAFIFSAMRHFAKELEELGFHVDYIALDDPENSGSFRGEMARAITRHSPTHIAITEAGEYRVMQDTHSWRDALAINIDIYPDTRFLCSHEEFQQWTKGRTSLRMEYFYREMRKKHHILMNDGTAEGGQWNYDVDNRKPPKDGLTIPPSYRAPIDDIIRDVFSLVAKQFGEHFGDIEPFHYAVTRKQALEALNQFIHQRLIYFGDYQDAMLEGEPWMYHAHISLYLNCGLLYPMECIRAAEDAYHSNLAPLNAVEGFIRQILGWREYVRGIYWLNMPHYADENFFKATRHLPPLYWGGMTKMNCLSQCVKETKENAYAHHIQRLMVLGNFALLAGLAPIEVNEWYLIVYADAYEWVELPNVSGMVLFADGGYLASKPYAAGGSYINKMSDYCKSCTYKVTKKNGLDACPFNYLYWDFLDRNRTLLQSNHRIAMMYKTLDRMGEEKLNAIRNDADRFLKALDNGEKV